MLTPRPALQRNLRLVFAQYNAAFCVLCLVAAMGLLSAVETRIGWLGLVWLLLAVAIVVLAPVGEVGVGARLRGWQVASLLGFVVLAAWFLRWLPQQDTVLPLGYDYGFYKATMDHYDASSPIVPERGLPLWMKTQFEPGLFVLQQVLHEVAGLGAGAHLRTLFPLLSALVAVPVFVLARAHFGLVPGLVASALYAASAAQYEAYLYLYERNVVALGVALVACFAIRRRHFGTAGVLLGATAFIHRPTFLVAGVAAAAYGVYVMARERRWGSWWKVGAAAAPALALLVLLRPEDLVRLFSEFSHEATTSRTGAGITTSRGGSFLTFEQYLPLAAAYLFPALSLFVIVARRRDHGLLVLVLGLALLNALVQFVFFNRYLILLDLFALVAAPVAFSLLPSSRRRVWAAVASGAVMLAALAPTVGLAVAEPGPPFHWMTDEQFEGVRWIREQTPANATIIGGNVDAAYLKAESGRQSYGPGLFDDPHTMGEWREFIETSNPAIVRPFLEEYGTPVYVYHGEGHGPGLGTAKFVEPDFTLAYQGPGVLVWRFNRS